MLAIGTTLTPEQRLSKAVVDIMGNSRYVALGGVLMIGDRTIDDEVPTAITNGRDEKYGRQFIGGLNDAELRFLVLHECYHKLYRHLTTWQHLYNEDANLANQACDYVINIKLYDDNTDGFAVMPKGGLLDHKYRNWDSAAVFNDLKKQPKNNGGGGGKGSAGAGAGGGKPLDEHDWESAKDMSEGERNELARDIDLAIRQGALVAGKTGSGGDRLLQDLLQPKVDWRDVLREFVSSTCAGSDYSTWRKPNRRYVSYGMYMPSSISERVGEIVVAIDTSGSIGTQQLTEFLSEVRAVCDTVKPDCVHVLYWDTQVCRAEVYGDTTPNPLDALVTSTKPAGGGGTQVECVPEYMTTHGINPKAVIVFTDGYIGSSWGTWSAPLLWCIVNNKDAAPTVGKVVHVERC
jgi:predicted metal-dependent peptidase